MWWPDKIVWEDVQEKFKLLELLLVVFWNKHSDWLFLVKGFLLLVCEVSDMRSDTIITLIGSVKNVGIIPHKNVDHATPWAAGNRGPYGQPSSTEYWATEEAKEEVFQEEMHF